MSANNPPRNPHHFNHDQTKQTGFDMDLVTEPVRWESNFDFTCAVCLGLAHDPIDIGCRHLMCKSCLGNRKDHEQRKKLCPQCRREIQFTRNRISNEGQMEYNAHRVRCHFGSIECGF